MASLEVGRTGEGQGYIYMPGRGPCENEESTGRDLTLDSGESQRWLYKFENERSEASNGDEGHEMG